MVWRIILVLIPVLGLGLWLRYVRMAAASEEALEEDLLKLRRRLIALLAVYIGILGIWYTMAEGGPAGDCYIPDRLVDGKILAGEFVAFDDPRCAEDEARRAAEPSEKSDKPTE